MIPMKELENLDNHALLVELNRSQRQNSRWQLIAGAAVMAIVAIMLTAALIVVPRTMKLMGDIQASVEAIDTLIEETETSMGKVSTMLDEISPAVEGLDQSMEGIDEMVSGINSLVTDNSENLAEAIEKLNSIDFETLNKAIQELETTVEPLSKFLGAFNR